MATRHNIEWADVRLEDVTAHFATGFEFADGSKLVKHEAFVDTAKGRVVFKLHTELHLPKTQPL